MSHEAASAVGRSIASFTYGFQLRKVVPSISIFPVQESGSYGPTSCSRIAARAVTGLNVEPGG